ncbi:MAG: hypothetical protein AB8G22_02185 [Saprospiraceae bacterium]
MFISSCSEVKFQHNPFQGLTPSEIERAIVPRKEIKAVAQDIQLQKPTIIQFCGKKGRGKTTHLTFLHQYFSQHPMWFLNRGDRPNLKDTKVLFIDSIHPLSFTQRQRLYRSIPTIVLTTHHNRWYEFKIAKRSYQTIYFRGLQLADLMIILNQRLQLAVSPNDAKPVTFDTQFAAQLLRQYGDNLRGIINHLYDQFEEQYGGSY